MSRHDYPLLDIMLADMKLADELYRPTNFWKHGCSSVLNDIVEHGVEGFRSLTGLLIFFVPTYALPGYNSNPKSFALLHEALDSLELGHDKFDFMLDHFISGRMQALSDYRVYLASEINKYPYTDKASESSIGRPVEQFTFDGRCFSRSFLNYLLGLNFLKRTCNTEDIHTVLEIGGGFGSLGEILLGDKRNDSFYIDVDIAPTAFVATYYLQQLFGQKNVGDYTTLRHENTLQIDQFKKKYKAVVLNSWQLPKLQGQIDLFVNFISFQEMEPDVVQNYLVNVDRLGAKFVLLRNLRQGKHKAEDTKSLGVMEPVKSEDYGRFLPNYRLAAVNTIPFSCETVDNFHSELKVFVRAQ